ncbi:MAG: hypothetical protein JXR77_05790, partial [Lentisphaeria bacterium]|nr:hypothetical protein [Lentisphaeria bacterium]
HVPGVLGWTHAVWQNSCGMGTYGADMRPRRRRNASVQSGNRLSRSFALQGMGMRLSRSFALQGMRMRLSRSFALQGMGMRLSRFPNPPCFH